MQLQYLKAINRLVVVWVEQKKKNTDIYILIQNHDFIFLKTLQCIFSILLWLYKNLFFHFIYKAYLPTNSIQHHVNLYFSFLSM